MNILTPDFLVSFLKKYNGKTQISNFQDFMIGHLDYKFSKDQSLKESLVVLDFYDSYAQLKNKNDAAVLQNTLKNNWEEWLS
jgi:hypothetical protein